MVKLAFVASVIFSLIVINNAFKIDPKIVRGFSAKSGQFPFFAFLEVKSQAAGGGGFFPFFFMPREQMSACGASLISDEWVLTAAHCIRNVRELVVHLGKSDLSKPEQSHLPIAIPVTRQNIFIFPKYDYNNALHDIALIRLPQKVQFNDFIKPLSLPTECKSPENVQAFAVGNGATRDNSGVSPQLKFALLDTLPANICRRVYPNVGRTIVCAANNKDYQSVCSGDSGGPLVSRADGNLIGISCFVRGDIGCEQGIPQGFTNVYPYLGWIGHVTGMKLPQCRV